MGLSGRGRRDRVRAEAGFTLIELLIVVVVIGVLAAIAVPAFLNQREKAQDARAKALVRAGVGVLESFATERGGYDATRAQVLDDAPELADTDGWTLSTEFSQYTIAVTASSGNVFKITRGLTIPAVRTCASPGEGGCSADGTW